MKSNGIIYSVAMAAAFLPAERKEELLVDAVDYLRILEAGNFMTFVAMVVHTADKISVVKQQNIRLKVCTTYVHV